MNSPRSIARIILAGGILVWSAGLGHALAQGVKYDSQGKRDPFVNLKKANQKVEAARFLAPPPLDQRPPGLAGLLVSEVTVTGMAKGTSSHLVLLKGIDEVSYFARVGTKLFDGYVETIDAGEVVFIREQVDTKGSKKVTRVKKQMQTEER